VLSFNDGIAFSTQASEEDDGHQPDRSSSSRAGGSGGSSYSVEIGLERVHGKCSRQTPPRVYAPRFPKVLLRRWGKGK
jgi:hypothetical protein